MIIFKPELVDRVWKKINVGREGRKEKVKKRILRLPSIYSWKRCHNV